MFEPVFWSFFGFVTAFLPIFQGEKAMNGYSSITAGFSSALRQPTAICDRIGTIPTVVQFYIKWNCLWVAQRELTRARLPPYWP